MDGEIEFVLVSACLLGINCRYDGGCSAQALHMLKNEIPIPICPEQLGGLPTPREPADLCGGSGKDILKGNGRILGRKTGNDCTLNFIRGAQETLKIASLFSCKKAILKDKSPSCGYGKIYLDGKLANGNGVTAELLAENGLKIMAI